MSSAKKFQGYNQTPTAEQQQQQRLQQQQRTLSCWRRRKLASAIKGLPASRCPCPDPCRSLVRSFVLSLLLVYSYFKSEHTDTATFYWHKGHLLLLAHSGLKRNARIVVRPCHCPGHWLPHLQLGPGFWLPAAGCRLLAAGCWLLVTNNVLTFCRAYISKANYMRS